MAGIAAFADEILRFMLVGKTGSGKSTTGNTILGGRFFASGITFDSVTTDCQLKTAMRDGVTIEIMDSPGLFDTNKSQEETSIAIVKAVAGMHPGPHVFLYVLTIGRFTDEDASVYHQLLSLFDEEVVNYTIVLFTGGDRLKESGTYIQKILQTAPDNLRKVLHACENRFVVFNNKAADKLSQVSNLLQTAQALVRGNGDAPYTCPKYFQIGKRLEEEVARRVAQREKMFLKKSSYVRKLKAQLIQTKKTLDREKEEFQKREKVRQQEIADEDDVRNKQFERMMHMIQQLHMDQEKRQEEEEKALYRKLVKEREEERRKREIGRTQDQEYLKKIERKLKDIEEKIEQQSKQQQEQHPENEMQKLKEGIVENKEPNVSDALKILLREVMDMGASYVPFLGTAKEMFFK